MKLSVIFQPSGKTIEVKPGTSILDASHKAKVHIRTRCGGNAGCLMCKVTVSQADGLAPMGENEKRKLGSLADHGIRLACQAKIIGHVAAHVPEDPLKAAVREQLAKQQEEDW